MQKLFLTIDKISTFVGHAFSWLIVALTLVIRAVVIPLYRRQLVSQRRMQMLQPEIKEIQRRYKNRIDAFVKSDPPLPNGHWVVVLKVDQRIAKQMDVILRGT